MVETTFRSRDISSEGDKELRNCRENYAALVAKLLLSGAGRNALFVQFPVPNFQKWAGCRSDAIFAKNFPRQLRFLASSPPSFRLVSSTGGRRNDLPWRQTASESLSLQPTHSSWQTDSPHLFQSLLGTPAKDTTLRIDARQPTLANASQNILYTNSVCRRAGESKGESERVTRGLEDSVTERKRRRTIPSEDRTSREATKICRDPTPTRAAIFQPI